MARASSINTGEPAEAERLLLALADHLHEHCECGGVPPRCAACDLRRQLRAVREDLLAWRADGRRVAARRDDAIANGAVHVAHTGVDCAECAALATLAQALGAGRRGADPPPYSATSSS
jgi:hypothetical protein